MIDVLEEMIKDASKRAEKCFKKHGELVTQYRALCGDGEWITLAAPFSSAMERDISRMMVRVLFEERNVRRYVHIAEAWASPPVEPGEDPLAGPAPSDDPNRQEGILIIAEGRTLGQAQGFRFIDRTGKRPRLTSLHIDRPKEIIGRYGSMLIPINGAQARN